MRPTTASPFDAHHDAVAVSHGAVVYRIDSARCHGLDARGGGTDALADYAMKDVHAFDNRLAVTLRKAVLRAWLRKRNEGSGPTLNVPHGDGLAMLAFGQTLALEQIWPALTHLQRLDIHVKPQS